MDYIPALNSKGRFSLAKVRAEVKKIDQPKKKRVLSLGWFVLLVLLIGVCSIFWARHFAAAAAVFDNTTPYISTGFETRSSVGGTDYRIPYWTFTSSTLQLELTDVSLKAIGLSYDATNTLALHVWTDKGSWIATTTQFIGTAAYTTSTFRFSTPHPWATPGSDWNMWLEAPASSTLYQIMWAGTSSSLSEFTFSRQYFNCLSPDGGAADCGGSTDVLGSPYYMVPQMVLNASGTGAMTIWTPPPDPGTYGLNSTSSAANQDFGFFGNMFRDVLIWLFEPMEEVKTYYNDQKDVLLNQKVPFAYFSDAIADIESVSGTTSGTEMIVGATTTLGYFQFFDTTAIKANPIISILDTIKFWLRIAMWLGFLFWIYETIKEFKP